MGTHLNCSNVMSAFSALHLLRNYNQFLGPPGKITNSLIIVKYIYININIYLLQTTMTKYVKALNTRWSTSKTHQSTSLHRSFDNIGIDKRARLNSDWNPFDAHRLHFTVTTKKINNCQNCWFSIQHGGSDSGQIDIMFNSWGWNVWSIGVGLRNLLGDILRGSNHYLNLNLKLNLSKNSI